jgi:hypothetical protein
MSRDIQADRSLGGKVMSQLSAPIPSAPIICATAIVEGITVILIQPTAADLAAWNEAIARAALENNNESV